MTFDIPAPVHFMAIILGSLGTYLFGRWDSVIQVLLVLVVLDYLTGVMAAYASRTLNSQKGFRGILKKVCIFAIVATANILDGITGMPDPLLRTTVLWFFIANEGLSILENSASMGLPLPVTLIEALERLKTRKD